VNLTVNYHVIFFVNLEGGTDMEFIKPKKTQGRKVNWIVSEHTRAIVKYYAQYTEYSEDEVVDTFLKNLLKDEDFLEWIQKKRFNKRITDQLLINVEEEEEQLV
jgi:hypothetical protein